MTEPDRGRARPTGMRLLGPLLLPLTLLLVGGCSGDPAPEAAPDTPAASESPALPSPSESSSRPPDGPGVVPHEDEGVARVGDVATRTARCVFDAQPGFSFDGTVTAVGDGEVTFEVNESFGGDLPATYVVEMGAPVKGRASETGASYSVGTRMLVNGSRGVAWGCGRTVYYDETTADSWRS